MVWETNEFRLSLAEGKDRRLLAQGKPGKSQGENSFSPGDYSLAFPGCFASGLAAF
jgi:hypothetical protein